MVIHNGLNTHHQDQSIFLVILRTMKEIVSSPVKNSVTDDELDVLDIMIMIYLLVTILSIRSMPF